MATANRRPPALEVQSFLPALLRKTWASWNWQLTWGGFPKSPAATASSEAYRQWLRENIWYVKLMLPFASLGKTSRLPSGMKKPSGDTTSPTSPKPYPLIRTPGEVYIGAWPGRYVTGNCPTIPGFMWASSAPSAGHPMAVPVASCAIVLPFLKNGMELGIWQQSERHPHPAGDRIHRPAFAFKGCFPEK